LDLALRLSIHPHWVSLRFSTVTWGCCLTDVSWSKFLAVGVQLSSDLVWILPFIFWMVRVNIRSVIYGVFRLTNSLWIRSLIVLDLLKIIIMETPWKHDIHFVIVDYLFISIGVVFFCQGTFRGYVSIVFEGDTFDNLCRYIILISLMFCICYLLSFYAINLWLLQLLRVILLAIMDYLVFPLMLFLRNLLLRDFSEVLELVKLMVHFSLF
jgi:hypothetical protein